MAFVSFEIFNTIIYALTKTSWYVVSEMYRVKMMIFDVQKREQKTNELL